MTRCPTITLRKATTLLASGTLIAAILPAPTAAGHVPTLPSEDGSGHFEEAVLWDSEADPLENYHVHGLVVTPDDTVLAFTEGRHEECDAAAREILLRRSDDGGRTWDASRTIVPTEDGESWGNPTAVVDEETGEVFLFFGLSIQDDGNDTCSGDRQEISMIRSSDNGETWTDPVEMPELFEDNPYEWTLHGPGPGHGVQLQDGRLLVQVLHRREVLDNTVEERMYGVSAIYSDDHGETWQASEPVPVDVDYPINESRLFERGDGSVVVNGRSAAGGHRSRISSVSTDGGLTWSDPAWEPATGRYTAVDAGFVGFEGADGVSRVLHSRPDSARREAMTVGVSYDEGHTFRYERLVNPGSSYYSDMAVLSDDTVLLIYGRDGEILSAPQRVAVARFDLDWLTDGRDDGSSGPGFTEYDVELGDASKAETGSGNEPEEVHDDNARGSRSLLYEATGDGDYIEYPFSVDEAGSYELAIRHHRADQRGKVGVSVNGEEVPEGLVDPTLADGDAYHTYQHGSVDLTAGTHVMRLTLEGEGHLGGSTIAPDHMTLTSATDEHDLVRDIVVDDESIDDFRMDGEWERATGQTGHPYYGVSYRSRPAGSGDNAARWQLDVPVTGTYNVLVWYVAHSNRASDAPFTVHHDEGEETVRVDQRGQAPSLEQERPGVWVDLGAYPFQAGSAGFVELLDDADGHVIADAVRLTRAPVPDTPTNLEATAESPESIGVSWNGVADAGEYHVERRVDGDSAWELAGQVPAAETSFTSDGLEPGTSYEHRVYAVDEEEPDGPAYGSAATDPVRTTTP